MRLRNFSDDYRCKKQNISFLFLIPIAFLLLLISATSCREDELVVPTEYTSIGDNDGGGLDGLYLLNEGNMGSNKATLDFYDYKTGTYARNIYAQRNPYVIKELGDVGNDVAVYGSKLYIVLNASHKVEVVDAYTAMRIGQINVDNCRYVRFYNGKAYVSSYVGKIAIDPSAPLGEVVEVDTTSLAITRRVTVGYQPEEFEFVDGKMYVANSGGYRPPEYDDRVTVVDMNTFEVERNISVDINLHRLKKDQYDNLWVSSRGNMKDVPSRLYMLSNKFPDKQMRKLDQVNVPVSDMAIRGDSLYYISSAWSSITHKNEISYGILNMQTRQVVSTNFITDGTEKNIAMPYSIALHPTNGSIFVTDAKNYVSSGTLYCFDKNGKKRWSIATGDIPAHIAFLPKRGTKKLINAADYYD